MAATHAPPVKDPNQCSECLHRLAYHAYGCRHYPPAGNANHCKTCLHWNGKHFSGCTAATAIHSVVVKGTIRLERACQCGVWATGGLHSDWCPLGGTHDRGEGAL